MGNVYKPIYLWDVKTGRDYINPKPFDFGK